MITQIMEIARNLDANTGEEVYYVHLRIGQQVVALQTDRENGEMIFSLIKSGITKQGQSNNIPATPHQEQVIDRPQQPWTPEANTVGDIPQEVENTPYVPEIPTQNVDQNQLKTVLAELAQTGNLPNHIQQQLEAVAAEQQERVKQVAVPPSSPPAPTHVPAGWVMSPEVQQQTTPTVTPARASAVLRQHIEQQNRTQPEQESEGNVSDYDIPPSFGESI